MQKPEDSIHPEKMQPENNQTTKEMCYRFSLHSTTGRGKKGIFFDRCRVLDEGGSDGYGPGAHSSTDAQKNKRIPRSTTTKQSCSTAVSPPKGAAAPNKRLAAGIPHPLKLDICLGRGGMANNHHGNKQYRDIALLYKQSYLDAKCRKDKGIVVQEVMGQLHEEGYRFVLKSKTDGLWYPAPPAKVRAKVIQALREFAFDLRKEEAAAAGAASSKTTTTTHHHPPCPNNSSSSPTRIGKRAEPDDSPGGQTT